MDSNEKYNYEKLEKCILNCDYDAAFDLLRPFILINTYILINSFRKSKSNLSIKNNKLYKYLLKPYNAAIRLFIEKHYSFKPVEEIQMDIKYILFILIKRYKKSNRNFCAYLSNSFHYEMVRFLYSQNKEILNHNGVKLYFDNGDCNLYNIKDTIDFQLDIILDYVDIDNQTMKDKWIDEITFSKEDSLFYGISPFDKKILIEYYQNDLSDKDISIKYKKHLNTINKRRRESVKFLSNRFNTEYVQQRKIAQ